MLHLQVKNRRKNTDKLTKLGKKYLPTQKARKRIQKTKYFFPEDLYLNLHSHTLKDINK